MIDIDTLPKGKLFSVCSLVTNMEEYREMVASFHSAGFTDENAEFFYADNTQGNRYDGFQGAKSFLTHASGEYIILCHQDILLTYDRMETLLERIEEVSQIDPNWALLGNAGYNKLTKKALRISDPYGMNISIGSFPAQVQSLDENFLVVRRSANISLSNDLSGFHFYGVDLCIIATILGYSAYVIDFHLYHKSGGTCNESFFTAKSRLIEKYRKALQPKFIRTTCTTLFLSPSRCLNTISNLKIIVSLKKRCESLYAKFF